MQEAQRRDAVVGPERLVHDDAVDLGAVRLAEVEGDDGDAVAGARESPSSACCTSAPPTIGRAGSRASTGQR